MVAGSVQCNSQTTLPTVHICTCKSAWHWLRLLPLHVFRSRCCQYKLATTKGQILKITKQVTHRWSTYFWRMNPAISGESLAGLLQGPGFELPPLLGFRPPPAPGLRLLLLLGSGSSSASKCALAAALPVSAINTTCSGSHVSSVQERTYKQHNTMTAAAVAAADAAGTVSKLLTASAMNTTCSGNNVSQVQERTYNTVNKMEDSSSSSSRYREHTVGCVCHEHGLL
jgi:hypothetical protein